MLLPIISLELHFHHKETDLLTKKYFNSNLPIVYYKIDEYIYIYYKTKYFSITYYLYHKNKNIKIIRILYDYSFLFPVYIYFSSHIQEGIWIPFNKCKYINNYLICYVSLNSYCLNPYPKNKIRNFGLSNDYYSKKGKSVQCILIEDPSLPYITILNKEVFNNIIKRFFIILFSKKIDKYKKKQIHKEKKINKITSYSYSRIVMNFARSGI